MNVSTMIYEVQSGSYSRHAVQSPFFGLISAHLRLALANLGKAQRFAWTVIVAARFVTRRLAHGVSPAPPTISRSREGCLTRCSQTVLKRDG